MIKKCVRVIRVVSDIIEHGGAHWKILRIIGKQEKARVLSLLALLLYSFCAVLAYFVLLECGLARMKHVLTVMCE